MIPKSPPMMSKRGNMTGLKFGLALPYTNSRVVAEYASLAEEAGWDGCFLEDALWCEDRISESEE